MFIWIFATIISFFVKGLCGFANVPVFTTLLSFTEENILISPVALLLGVPSNLMMIRTRRKYLDLKKYFPMILLVAAGCVPGVLLLKHLDTGVIKIIFSIVVIILSINMIWEEKHPGSKTPRWFILLIAVVSGLLCGLFGIGVLMGIYLGKTTDDTRAFKANICLILGVENLFRTVLYLIEGIITTEAIRISMIMLPFMGLGIAGGSLAAKRMDEGTAKKFTTRMLLISGVMLLLRTVIR